MMINFRDFHEFSLISLFFQSSSETRRKEKAKEHHKERKKIRRPAGQLQSKSKPTTKFWMGKKFS